MILVSREKLSPGGLPRETSSYPELVLKNRIFSIVLELFSPCVNQNKKMAPKN